MWFPGFLPTILSLIVEVYLWWKLQAPLIFLRGRTCTISSRLNTFLPHCLSVSLSISLSISLSLYLYIYIHIQIYTYIHTHTHPPQHTHTYFLFPTYAYITIGGEFILLSCRNSSSVTISLPGEDGRVIDLTRIPRCGWALCGMWSYGRVELRARAWCDWLRPMTSSLERLAERPWWSDVSKMDINIIVNTDRNWRTTC